MLWYVYMVCCCWWVVGFCLGQVHSQEESKDVPIVLAYEVLGARRVPEVNTRFYCTKPGLCFSQLSSTRRLKLYRTSVYLSPQESQVRWYIEDIPPAGTRSSGSQKLYGVVELEAFPTQFKTWKRIQMGSPSEEEVDMTLTPFSLTCRGGNNASDTSLLFDKMELLHDLLFKATDNMDIVSTEVIQSLFVQCQMQLIQQLKPTTDSVELTLQVLVRCDALVLRGDVLAGQRCLRGLQQQQQRQQQQQPSVHVTHLQQLLNIDDNNTATIATVHPVKLRRFVQAALDRLAMFQIARHQDASLLTHSLRASFYCDHSPQQQQTSPNGLVVIASYLAGEYVHWGLVHARDAKLLLFSRCPASANTLQVTAVPVTAVMKTLDQIQQYLLTLPNDGSKASLQAIFYKVQFYFQKLQSIIAETAATTSTEVPAAVETSDVDSWVGVMSTDALQRQHASFLLQDYHVTYSTSLVHSLLEVGAVQVAASHLAAILGGMTQYFLQQSQQSESVEESRQVAMLMKLLQQYEVDNLLTASGRLEETLLTLLTTSSNVRSLARLAALLQSPAVLPTLTRDADLFHAFLSTSTQIASPVILSTSTVDADSTWLDEVLSLRVLMLDILDTLQTYCNTASDGVNGGGCYLRADGQSAGVRGLFLEAYQGLALLHSFLAAHDATDKLLQNTQLLDHHCTQQYIALLRAVQTVPEILPPLANEIALSTIATTKKLRVGFMSYSLTRHSVGRLLSKIIAYLYEHETDLNMEVYIISNINATLALHKLLSSTAEDSGTEQQVDDVTKYLLQAIPAHRWIVLPLYVYDPAFTAAIDQMYALALDCVVYTDILMQPYIRIWSHRIRLGKVQLAFWGHPYSTGDGDWIDYFITSDLFEAHQHHQAAHRSVQFEEQLVAFDFLSFQLFPAEPIATSLASTAAGKNKKNIAKATARTSAQERQEFLDWLFQESYDLDGRKGSEQMRSFYRVLYYHQHPVQTASTVSMQDIVAEIVESTRVYGSLQSLMKMHPLFDEAIVQLLQQDPHAVVVLLRTPKQSEWQASFQHRLLRRIQQSPQNTSITVQQVMDRIFFVNQLPHTQYARIICQLDVALDPFPFGGGVTMCDAIAGHCPRHGNNVSSIPFVTSGYLQSVHHIAAGISQVVNNPNVARDSDRSCAYLQQSNNKQLIQQSSLQTKFAQHTQALIACYVNSAVDLATQSQRKYLHRAEDQQEEEEDMIAAEGRNPYEVIYNDLDVVAGEWSRFLHRIAS